MNAMNGKTLSVGALLVQYGRLKEALEDVKLCREDGDAQEAAVAEADAALARLNLRDLLQADLDLDLATRLDATLEAEAAAAWTDSGMGAICGCDCGCGGDMMDEASIERDAALILESERRREELEQTLKKRGYALEE